MRAAAPNGLQARRNSLLIPHRPIVLGKFDFSVAKTRQNMHVEQQRLTSACYL